MSKQKNNLTRIRALMLLSQVLLVCFMIYWLRSEYYGEREGLRKDLMVQLEHAQNSIADSVITVTILNPIMKGMHDESEQSDLKFTARDTIHTVSIRPSAFQPDPPPDKRVFRQEETFTIHPNNGDATRTLTRGVKMILNGVNNLPPGMNNALTHTDTFLLSRIFKRNAAKAGLNIAARWIDSTTAPAKALLLAGTNTPGYRLEILSYAKYLVRKMIPQFLIALILLGLTTIAFLVTYKNLHAQTRLAAIRNDFISNMSHELKTPVSTVKVALEAMGEPEVLADLTTTKDYVRMATLELARLEMLINQTLQTSLLEEGRMMIQAEPVNLQLLTDELIRTMQPRFSVADARVETRYSGNRFIVSADKLQVQGVIINILDNALKYAGPSPALKLLLTETRDAVVLSISDSGPGIPKAYADRIFDKFFRVPRGNEHSVKGYGLGLSYASQVMKLHGGSISMQPSDEGGCNFLLSFKTPHL